MHGKKGNAYDPFKVVAEAAETFQKLYQCSLEMFFLCAAQFTEQRKNLDTEAEAKRFAECLEEIKRRIEYVPPPPPACAIAFANWFLVQSPAQLTYTAMAKRFAFLREQI